MKTNENPLLSSRPYFNLEVTTRVLQRRPQHRVVHWEDGRLLRSFHAPHGPALLAIENKGTFEAPRLVADLLYGEAEDLPWLLEKARDMLGLMVDSERFYETLREEKAFWDLAEALRGMRPPRYPDLFESFCSVIPFQQVSLESGSAILGRFVDAFGGKLRVGGRDFALFPMASDIKGLSVDALREVGLSRIKAESILGIAEAISNGDLHEEGLLALSSQEAEKKLTKLRGIGPWSAALVLLRGLGRLDVFPPGDVGVLKGLNQLLGEDREEATKRVMARFHDATGYLYLCLMGASLMKKGVL